MSMLDDLKRVASEDGVELTDEMLDSVAGGYYSDAEWLKMTVEERDKAVRTSMAIKIMGTGDYCKYFDPDPVN